MFAKQGIKVKKYKSFNFVFIFKAANLNEAIFMIEKLIFKGYNFLIIKPLFFNNLDFTQLNV